jgi:hypothetical protein
MASTRYSSVRWNNALRLSGGTPPMALAASLAGANKKNNKINKLHNFLNHVFHG